MSDCGAHNHSKNLKNIKNFFSCFTDNTGQDASFYLESYMGSLIFFFFLTKTSAGFKTQAMTGLESLLKRSHLCSFLFQKRKTVLCLRRNLAIR